MLPSWRASELHDQGRADRATLALSFSILAMLFSAGTMFFYYELSQLKAEEVRQTVGSRALLTDAIKEMTQAFKEMKKSAQHK